MLYKYKNDYEKIAMGFLSFLPDLKDMTHLQAELKLYQSDDSRCLYLWKNDAGDFTGVVGVELGSDYVIIRHLSLNPSDRQPDNIYSMLDELTAIYPDKKIMGSLETAKIVADWERHQSSRA